MKVCPSCQRSYAQPDIRFCLDDGAILQSATAVKVAVGGGGATDVQYERTMAPTPVPTNVGPSTDVQYEHTIPPRATPTDAEGATDMQLPDASGGDTLRRGAKVGEYVIDKRIGEGGMGIIFSATQPLIGKQVAIKVLNTTMSANPDVVQRFIQEAKSVNQIRHRNIVDIFSFGSLPDGRQYFVMELLEGQPLGRRIRESTVDWAEAVALWLQIASAIEAAHKHGIVHRDLKPDNVFITPTDDGPFVKVLDFGIAKLLGDTGGMTATSTGMPIGTPQYMAPEQAAGTKVDARADIYAFGVIMFETMSGRPPFVRDTVVQLLNDHMNTPAPDIGDVVQRVDAELSKLVSRMLAKDPAHRPVDMSEVRTELAFLRDRAMEERKPLYGATFGDDPTKTSQKPPSAVRRRRAVPVVIGAVSLAAALGVGGVLLLNKPPKTAVVVTPEPLKPEPPKPEPPKPVVPEGPKPGRLVLTTNTPTTRVFLDKSPTEKSTEPVAAGGSTVRVSVPPAVMWSVRIESDGFKPAIMPLRLADGEETALPVVLTKDDTGKKTGKHHQTATPTKTENPVTPPTTENGKFLDPFAK